MNAMRSALARAFATIVGSSAEYQGYWRRGFEHNAFFPLHLTPPEFRPWLQMEPPDLFAGWHVRFLPGVHEYPERPGFELPHLASTYVGFGHTVTLLRVRGRLTRRGSYGHFGVHRRELLITEILEARAPAGASQAI